jgi:hypothetical protein
VESASVGETAANLDLPVANVAVPAIGIDVDSSETMLAAE